MSADVGLGPGGSIPSLTLRSIVTAPVNPQTYRNLVYLLTAFPLGLFYFVFLAVGLSVGLGLVITVVGVPILLTILAIATGLGSLERKLAVKLLGVDIDPPGNSPLALADERPLQDRLKALVVGMDTWKAVVYLASKFVFGLVAFVLITSLLVTAVSLLLVPTVYDRPNVYVGFVVDEPMEVHPSLAYAWNDLLVGVRAAFELTSWQVTTLPEALVLALLGLGLIIISLNVLNGLAWLSGRYAKLMLGGRTGAAEADIID